MNDYFRRGFDDAVKKINEEYDAIVNAKVRLWQKNEELHDKHYKDKELAKMKEELDYVKNHSVFILSDEQQKIKEEFDKHLNGCNAYHKYGTFEYKVTPTSIGTAVDLVCCCGHEVELIGL